ncbi:MAG: GHMP kinase [Peptococcaceae bacterium]|nr:GHMP kinase [Peptococcaceae bacterium]
MNYSIEEEFAFNGQLDLVKGVLKKVRKRFDFPSGFQLYLQNDAPPGSGLGSSSTMVVAILRVLQEWLKISWTQYELAELAYEIERIDLCMTGGRQDHYATVFGGFNLMEFNGSRVIVNPLIIKAEIIYELEYSILLVYLKGLRDSSNIINEQVENYKNKDQVALSAMDRLKEIAVQMKHNLLKGEIKDLGYLLHEEWEHKKKIAKGITNQYIDAVYEEAHRAGAIGGKILGAGGGGYMLLLCDPIRRHLVMERVQQVGGQIAHFQFVNNGIQAWSLLNR